MFHHKIPALACGAAFALLFSTASAQVATLTLDLTATNPAFGSDTVSGYSGGTAFSGDNIGPAVFTVTGQTGGLNYPSQLTLFCTELGQGHLPALHRQRLFRGGPQPGFKRSLHRRLDLSERS